MLLYNNCLYFSFPFTLIMVPYRSSLVSHPLISRLQLFKLQVKKMLFTSCMTKVQNLRSSCIIVSPIYTEDLTKYSSSCSLKVMLCLFLQNKIQALLGSQDIRSKRDFFIYFWKKLTADLVFFFFLTAAFLTICTAL